MSMAVRMVDCGIPNFELKKKRYELQPSNDEILVQEDDSAKKKKKYAFKDDTEGQLELYKKILRKIPAKSGKLMLITGTDSDFQLLGVLSSEDNLREDFRTSKKVVDGVEYDRFNWLMLKLRTSELRMIRFVLAFEV